MARLAKEKFLILTVADAENDRLLLRLTLSQADRMRFIGNVSDGQELLGCMKGEGKYADREKYPLPDRLLLDWVVLRKDGSEVMEWLRGQPFDDLVVVLFSGPERMQAVEKPFSFAPDRSRGKNEHAFRHPNLIKLLQEYLSHK